MGLFSSHDDMEKLNGKLSGIDEEKLYKKALAALEVQGSEIFNQLDSTEISAIVLHHDLQEIKQELQKLNEK